MRVISAYSCECIEFRIYSKLTFKELNILTRSEKRIQNDCEFSSFETATLSSFLLGISDESNMETNVKISFER